MRVLIQRVSSASVSVDKKLINEIESGLLIFLGVKTGDTQEDAAYLATRSAALRIFSDENDKMNLSVKDIAGSALVISQFTLYADTRKGNRPSYTDAAPPEIAEQLYEYFVEKLRAELGNEKVKTGIFRAMMEIALVNDGPVTVMVESKEK